MALYNLWHNLVWHGCPFPNKRMTRSFLLWGRGDCARPENKFFCFKSFPMMNLSCLLLSEHRYTPLLLEHSVSCTVRCWVLQEGGAGKNWYGLLLQTERWAVKMTWGIFTLMFVCLTSNCLHYTSVIFRNWSGHEVYQSLFGDAILLVA